MSALQSRPLLLLLACKQPRETGVCRCSRDLEVFPGIPKVSKPPTPTYCPFVYQVVRVYSLEKYIAEGGSWQSWHPFPLLLSALNAFQGSDEFRWIWSLPSSLPSLRGASGGWGKVIGGGYCLWHLLKTQIAPTGLKRLGGPLFEPSLVD